MTNVISFNPVLIFSTISIQVRSATATIQIFSFSLSKKALELKNEKGKVHSLLFETLPRVIALEYTQVKLSYIINWNTRKFNLLFRISFPFLTYFSKYRRLNARSMLNDLSLSQFSTAMLLTFFSFAKIQRQWMSESF